nr:MAG TPA: hypothetical protein [Caudoviricetes sp.]
MKEVNSFLPSLFFILNDHGRHRKSIIESE